MIFYRECTWCFTVLLALLILLGIPVVAWANAGVPMIVLVMPALGLSIIPITVIEAFYLGRKLALSFSKAVKTAAIANLVSTLVGVPLAWLVLVFLQMITGGGGAFGFDSTLGKVLSVTLQAAWLIPYESDLHWMIPVAGLVLMVPFFFVSWWSESYVAKTMLKEYPAQKVNVAVRNANILTYFLLAFWPFGYLILNRTAGQ